MTASSRPSTVSALLTELVATAAAAAGHDGVLDALEPASPTSNPSFGDYQSNHAFRLGKALKTNPRAVAEAVKAALPVHPAVVRADVAGPGFLNFHLDDAWLAGHVVAQVQDTRGGVEDRGQGRTVVIDYSSPNVAKRMHIGHMRSTIIGNALHRLYEAGGYRVVADNHIGDWGTQFGMLIVGWRNWLDEAAFADDAIGELERLYVKFREEAAADPTLDDLARAETAKLQAGDPDNRALWLKFIDISMVEFNGVYDRLGVRFDETLGESAYNHALPGVVDDLLDAGIAVEDAGAVVVRYPDDHDVKAVRGKLLVIRKQDGAYLYGTTDLATLEHRLSTWSPAEIVYVTDGRQQLHFQQVFAAWQAWRAHRGLPADGVALRHMWFGTLKLPEGMMSTRKGNVIRLVELLDEAVRRARAVVDEKSPDLPDALRAEIAEAVGIGAVRYSDLSQNPQSDVSFDWDRMLAMEGNTAPFLMYSLARCRSIQRKADLAPGETPLAPAANGALVHERERALLRLLARFPESVAAALETQRPNLLCDHLFEIAQAFNRFYFDVRVLDADSDDQRAARLALVELSAAVLSRGLGLLGVPALDRM
ncbi:MAG: arginine--tRNA ligase [Alphaproteobacteria bacterium]|nr:arginine--tRNA ligase [Alphaproteobacteria bacterium]